MARGKKERKVDTLRHKSGATVDIYFDPNTDGSHALTFSAQVGDQRFRNASAEVLRQEIHKYLNENTAATWYPAIVVSEVAPFSPGRAAFVGIEVDRVYLTCNNGTVRELNWDDYNREEDSFGFRPGESIDSFRLSRARQSWRGIKSLPDDLPHTSKSSDKETTVVPYTEELYAGLLEIDNGVRRLRERLRTLLKTDEGRSQVASVGASLLKMLPPAPDEKDHITPDDLTNEP